MSLFKRRTTPQLVIANWRDRSHPQAGGAEVVCEQLAKHFASEGHDVVLLTSAVAGQPSEEERDGYTVIRRGGRFTVYLWVLFWFRSHRNAIEGVIDSQNGIPFFTPLVVHRTTPVVLLLHHIHQAQFAQYFPPLAAGIGRFLERTGSRVVYGDRAVAAVSPSTRRGARHELGLRGTIYVVPPGWDDGIGPLAGPRLRQNHETIVCVGRLVPHKRTDLVVEAIPTVIASLPKIHLHIIGDGSERKRLEQLVTELGLEASVTIHGALEARARDRLLRTAWMTVNASEGEGWGLSVVEANALGIPALAYRRPGLRDSIRDGETGWLIDDHDKLGDAIVAALEELHDDQHAAALSQRAQEWSARFTWTAMADQVMGILKAEAGRLAQSDDRRANSDLATVVHVPADMLPEGWRPTFRLTDKWTMNEQGFAVLLPGADNEATAAALRRAGLPESIVNNPAVRVVVARPRDHISPVADLFDDLDSMASDKHAFDRLTPSSNGKAGPHYPEGSVQTG